ncbi:MAG: HAD family hydrolase [Pseudomonadota bacterium]
MTLRPWPKAILFDLDDTLWPIAPVIIQAELTLHAWLQAHAPQVAARFSIASLREARLALLARQPEFHLDLGALRRAGLHAAFAEAGEDGAKVDAAMSEFFAARNAVLPYDDVLPALLRLKGCALLGTITNGNADLHAIGLAHHFSVSVAAHQFGSAKPEAAIFHEACRRLDLAPADCLYVGDDLLLDVQAAQRAGLRAVWLKRGDGGAQPGPGVAPDATCADFDALLEWLRREHAPADYAQGCAERA